MRRLSIFFAGAILSFAFIYSGNPRIEASADSPIVYVGGMSAGFTLQTDGVQIIGICEVATENGNVSPASKAGIRSGDTIVKIGGIRIKSIAELNEIVNKSKGKSLETEIQRGKESLSFEITPKKDKESGRYKIGVLVRDNVSGIGTVTYIDKSGKFGSLGHAVEGENKRKMYLSSGTVYECSIVGVLKGERGKAGELRGMFLNDKLFGMAEKLCDCGIFGQVSTEFKTDELLCAVASSSGVKPGNAYIYSTVDGVCPVKYEIEIVKVDKYDRDNKDYVIKITDEALIAETGGIVQGMSGSPILQNGKLIGAVTHVFLNDPTRGYGIGIEKMLKEN